MNKFYYKYNIHNFKFTIAQIDNYITTITLDDLSLDYEYEETNLIKKTKQELTEYFNKERRVFDIPIKLTGTEFQNKIWQLMQEIPYGSTASYKDLAIKIGSKNYSRAVGNACNKNKLLIVIPCHRIIGTNSLGGFYYNIEIKQELLKLEKNN